MGAEGARRSMGTKGTQRKTLSILHPLTDPNPNPNPDPNTNPNPKPIPSPSPSPTPNPNPSLKVGLGLGSPSWWNQSWFYNPF